ncbi:MAG: hypothetical protein KF709_08095 [Gemmatimonadaceae bacterium]|nr:hypothetical protein [Gemmatimonadaceae bacterium]
MSQPGSRIASARLVSAARGILGALIIWVPTALSAQAGGRRNALDGIVPPAPSRADTMLAMGRLAAAEEALYAAVDARPRSPSPRGALAAYLASRGRFKIAEVLFDEAQRFGASPQAIRAAKERMAPYRAVVADGPAVAIRVSPRVGDPTSILAFVGRFSARGDSLQMFLDLTVEGVRVGRRAAERMRVRDGRTSLWIGERQLDGLRVTIDSLDTPDDVRVGLDVLWPLHPQLDTRTGILTLGRAPNAAAITGRVEQIPFVLTFPGLQLVPRVGQPPVALESRAGQALLRESRWQVDAATATLIVER